MKDDKPGAFGRIREVYETARNLACRIRSVSKVPFNPDLLPSTERELLQGYLAEVRNWADGLLRNLVRSGSALPKGAGGEKAQEECLWTQ